VGRKFAITARIEARLLVAAIVNVCLVQGAYAQNVDTQMRPVLAEPSRANVPLIVSRSTTSNVPVSTTSNGNSAVSGATGNLSPGEELFSSNKPRLRTGSPVQGSTRANTKRLPRNATRKQVYVPVAVLPAPEPVRPPIRRRRADEDPYAPTGIRMGGVTLYPSIDQNVGYDSNPNRAPGIRAKGSTLLRTDVEARLQSDSRVNALTGRLRGSYLLYPSIDGADRPELDGNLAYRHDFNRDLQGELELRGRIDTQRPGSPDLNVAVKDRPVVASIGTMAGLTQRFNRISIGLRGTVDRSFFQDASLTNGTKLSQSDRDFNQFGVRLRAGYDISPGLTPFVEALLDTRQYDETTDRFGFRRDSVGTGARVGSTFEITRKLTGEASVGYLTRRYDDARLGDLRGAIADAALIWSVSPITNVRVNLATTLDETSLVGASGAITPRAGVELTHEFQRNLAMTASLTGQRSDYRGVSLTEDTLTAGLRLDYKLTRSVVVRASYAHERLKSSAPGADYTANVYLLGLRLQR
jgi:hypothetical protein